MNQCICLKLLFSLQHDEIIGLKCTTLSDDAHPSDLFYHTTEHGKRCSGPNKVVIVAPQMRLQRALHWLLHPTHGYRSHTNSRRAPDTAAATTSPTSHRRHQDVRDEEERPSSTMSFPMHDSARPMYTSQQRRDQAMRTAQPPFRQRHQSDPLVPGDPTSAHWKPPVSDYFAAKSSSQEASPAGMGASGGSGTPSLPLIGPPSHLVVLDSNYGNVLGLICPDRLLAYLRLRLHQLPFSAEMTVSSFTNLSLSPHITR